MVVGFRRPLERHPQQRREARRKRMRKERIALDHAGIAVGRFLARRRAGRPAPRRRPRLARCSAIEVPTMPAPSTITSVRAMESLIADRCGRIDGAYIGTQALYAHGMFAHGWTRRAVRCPWRPAVLGERADSGEIDAPPAAHRPVDPGRRLRQARRGSARDRRRPAPTGSMST